MAINHFSQLATFLTICVLCAVIVARVLSAAALFLVGSTVVVAKMPVPNQTQHGVLQRDFRQWHFPRGDDANATSSISRVSEQNTICESYFPTAWYGDIMDMANASLAQGAVAGLDANHIVGNTNDPFTFRLLPIRVKFLINNNGTTPMVLTFRRVVPRRDILNRDVSCNRWNGTMEGTPADSRNTLLWSKYAHDAWDKGLRYIEPASITGGINYPPALGAKYVGSRPEQSFTFREWFRVTRTHRCVIPAGQTYVIHDLCSPARMIKTSDFDVGVAANNSIYMTRQLGVQYMFTHHGVVGPVWNPAPAPPSTVCTAIAEGQSSMMCRSTYEIALISNYPSRKKQLIQTLGQPQGAAVDIRTWRNLFWDYGRGAWLPWQIAQQGGPAMPVISGHEPPGYRNGDGETAMPATEQENEAVSGGGDPGDFGPSGKHEDAEDEEL